MYFLIKGKKVCKIAKEKFKELPHRASIKNDQELGIPEYLKGLKGLFRFNLICSEWQIKIPLEDAKDEILFF